MEVIVVGIAVCDHHHLVLQREAGWAHKAIQESSWLTEWQGVVLATVPHWRFSSGSGLEPNFNHCNGFYHMKQSNRTEPTVFWLVPHLCKLRTLPVIKYLSCDCITIWYLHKRCCFGCPITSHYPICNPITIRWVTSKNAYFSAIFHSISTDSDRITYWRIGGERTSKTASFMYRSYCDIITTQILNWSQSSEFTKMRLCCLIDPAKNPWVYVRSSYQPCKDIAVRFFGRVRNWTEPSFQSKPGPVANTNRAYIFSGPQGS